MSRPSRWRRAIGFVKPFHGPIALILLLSLSVAGLAAVEPLVLKMLFDELAGERGDEAILIAIAALVAIACSREAFTALGNWLTWRTRLRIHFDVLQASVAQLHRLPVAYHKTQGVGALMTRLDRGIQGFIGAFNDVAFHVLPAAVYLGLALFFMFNLHPKLAVVVLLFAPLPAVVAAWAAPVQTLRERRLLDRWASIYARFNEVLSGIVTVKSFAREEAEQARFLGGVAEANRIVERGVSFDASIGALQNILVASARVAAVGVGGLLVLDGSITVGTLVAFLGYVAGVFTPLQGLTSVYRNLRTASVSVDTIFDILEEPNGVADLPDAHELGEARGEIEFEDVHFSYDRGRPLLQGVNLHVKPGERIAIVGPSGAGKTTMLSLLQRFYDPTRGVVRIDGRDVRTLKQRELRASIGVVLQDALLFNDTVAANIAYGRPDASPAEIREAARNAHAHEMIMRMPGGYEAEVGEGGRRLSAGERQRVAIARVLLKDPPILILDEPTSALDAESEMLVQQALDRVTVGRTTLVIAHRLSTVVSADRIVVLRDGRVAETGPHAELMRDDGYYAGLVRRQVGGLLDDG